MVRNLATLVAIIYLATFGVGEVVTEDNQRSADKDKDEKPPPNILKDYVCLRDGELCHPNYATNRGIFVSCSNGVAWEQTSPRCTYHPITCPTKSLWFDGEKCDWANPKLASEPCMDRFPLIETIKSSTLVSEQKPFLQVQPGFIQKEVDKSKLANPMGGPLSMYFKSRKS